MCCQPVGVFRFRLGVVFAAVTACASGQSSRSSTASQVSDPLPSWKDAPAKRAITDFVTRVTTEGSPEFVPAPERIATFDNDGTLWSERPVPFQVRFAFDQVKAMAPQHPEWRTRQPFASVLKGDIQGLAATGEKGLLAIIAATHTGMTTDDFTKSVTDWIATAKHPKTGHRYTEMVFQPMLELLGYLRENGFKHHDDGDREFAYDRADKLQQFSKGWDEAVAKGWTVVSMKDDWKTIYPPENRETAAKP